jgi:hypothetical protein
MQTQDTGETLTTERFQRGILSNSMVGDQIQVKVDNGVIDATLQNYDKFNHKFQARLEDNIEVVFAASALYCPGKCS